MFFTVLTCPDFGCSTPVKKSILHQQIQRNHLLKALDFFYTCRRLCGDQPDQLLHTLVLAQKLEKSAHPQQRQKIRLPSGEMTDKPHLNKLDVDPTNRPPVLRLALLQHILLIHELRKSNILFVQQSLQVGGRV